VVVIVSPITNFPYSPSKPTALKAPTLRLFVKAQPKCRPAISRTPFSRLSVVSKSRSLSLANRSTTYKCPRSRTRDGPSIDSAALPYMSKKKNIKSVGDYKSGKKSAPKTSSGPQLWVISISGAPGELAMNTKVNFPFSESFLLVSCNPSAWKNAIVFSKLELRIIVCKKINSSSDGFME
jgi:hypothetical protein